MRHDILDHPYERPHRVRFGKIASVQVETRDCATCTTTTLMKLDVSSVDQTRSAVAASIDADIARDAFRNQGIFNVRVSKTSNVAVR